MDTKNHLSLAVYRITTDNEINNVAHLSWDVSTEKLDGQMAQNVRFGVVLFETCFYKRACLLNLVHFSGTTDCLKKRKKNVDHSGFSRNLDKYTL